MQTLSDVLGTPITGQSGYAQTCALGAAIYASVGAGLYASVEQAQAAICRPCRTIYQPDPAAAAYRAQKYQRYCELCRKIDASSLPGLRPPQKQGLPHGSPCFDLSVWFQPLCSSSQQSMARTTQRASRASCGSATSRA